MLNLDLYNKVELPWHHCYYSQHHLLPFNTTATINGGHLRFGHSEAQTIRRRRRRRLQEAHAPRRGGSGGGAGQRAARVRGARRSQHVHRGVGDLHGDGAGDDAPHVRRRTWPWPWLLHLQPPLQPDGAEPEPPYGGAGRHRGGVLHRKRDVGDHRRAVAAVQPRGTRGGVEDVVRWDPRAALALPPAHVRDNNELRGGDGSWDGGWGHGGGEDQGALLRGDFEPDSDGGEHTGALPYGATEGGDGGGGQHVRAYGAFAGASGCWCGGSQYLQVHQRWGRYNRRYLCRLSIFSHSLSDSSLFTTESIN